MNKIIHEQNSSKKYYLERVDTKDSCSLIKLSKDNVARVEAMIHFNSSYTYAFDKKEIGSSAYYFSELKNVLINKKRIKNSEYKELLRNTIRALDKENSTHLNSDGNGIETITERIYKIKKADLVHYLRYPKETDYRLINILADKTDPSGKSNSGNARRGRRNPSFASKFCHYACFFLFEGEKDQDNYSIYDSIIRKALPQYMELYGIEDRDINDYIIYQNTIDEIIKKSKSGISRNGFDHLLWYCNK